MKTFNLILVSLFFSQFTSAQWIIQNSGTQRNLNSVVFTDSTKGFAVGDSGTILKTINGGRIWFAVNSGTTNYLQSVSFPDDNTGYAVGSNGTIIKTTNAGLDWASLSSGVSEHLLSVYFINANTGYAVGGIGTYYNKILKTNDGGNSWNVKLDSSGRIWHSVIFTSLDTGYIAGGLDIGQQSWGSIIKTTDAGASWKKVYDGWAWGMSMEVYSICFTQSRIGYAVGCRRILKSEGIDSIWNIQYTHIPYLPYLYSSTCKSDTNGKEICYIVGDGGTILKNINGDSVWIKQNSGLM